MASGTHTDRSQKIRKVCSSHIVMSTGPDSSVGRVFASGNGRSRFDPGPRHTRVVKNGTSCSLLGTQS